MGAPTSPNAYTHMNTNTTATISSGDTRLFLVLIGTLGAAANVLTISDTTSLAVIAVIDTTKTGVAFYDFGGVRVAGGVKAVLATGTAADVTIITG